MSTPPADTPVVAPADLADFAGAPFSATAVAIAIADVQAACRWDIAPQMTETVTVEQPLCGWQRPYQIQLPTLHLTDLTAVRDVTDPANVVTVDGWSAAKTPDFTAGIVTRTGCPWPTGVLEFDIVHGYDTFPRDLLVAVAAAAQDVKVNKATGAVRLGSLSISNTGVVNDPVSKAIIRYRIPNIP